MKRIWSNKWFILVCLIALFLMVTYTKVALAGTDVQLDDSSGTVMLNNRCGTIAYLLRDQALLEGKYLSVIQLDSSEYQKWYGMPIEQSYSGVDQYHTICMARIEHQLWYVDPQTDRIWLACIFK